MGNAVWVTKEEHEKLLRLKESHGIRVYDIKTHKRPDMVAVVVDDDTFDKLMDYREENGHDTLEMLYIDRRFDPIERGYTVDLGKFSEYLPPWKIVAIGIAIALVVAAIVMYMLSS